MSILNETVRRFANNATLSNNNFHFHNLYLVIHGTPLESLLTSAQVKPLLVIAINIFFTCTFNYTSQSLQHQPMKQLHIFHGHLNI